jgi:hypothetical protein
MASSASPTHSRDFAERHGNASVPALMRTPQKPGFGPVAIPIAILIAQEVTRVAGAEFHGRTWRKSFRIIQENNYTGAISGGESAERC